MVIRKEKPERVYIQLTDARSRKSKSRTVEGATLEQVLQKIEQAFSPTKKAA